MRLSNHVSVSGALGLLLVFSLKAHGAFLPSVTVDGRDWMQPANFIWTSWNEVATVCDPVTGACSGDLNGGSLDGWTWATLHDVNALFNHFLPPAEQLVPPQAIEDIYIPAATDFFGALFFATATYFDPVTFDTYFEVNGMTRTALQESAYGGSVRDGDSIYVWDHIRIGTTAYDKGTEDSRVGHFFFRGPAFPAPVPASLALLLTGLAGLAGLRAVDARRSQ
ncbi:MAG: hypothetical protein Hals2KO_28870 [Halioglobus sp.]